MNKKNLNHFKRKLSAQLQYLLAGSDCNLDDLKAPDENRADPIDRAAYTTERNFPIIGAAGTIGSSEKSNKH